MKIAIVDRGSPIPASKYGGTERVIWGLGYELNKLGHQVTFVVPAGSKCGFANVIEYSPDIDLNSLIPEDTDFVHMNFVPTNELHFPHLITMHGNPRPDEILPFNTVFISANHAARHHSDVYVHNGLLWSDYPNIDLSLKRDYFHFLGKADWKVKNLFGAAKIAVKANIILKVLGGKRWKFSNFKRFPFYRLYPNIHYCGQVDNAEKIQILQKSNGLIFPVTWDEPFGLAIIESLYAGCPVFGTKKGSLPELINQSVGFLSDDYDEIIEAIKVKVFDPSICHQYAIENFNSLKMTENYIALYQEILNGKRLNTVQPHAK